MEVCDRRRTWQLGHEIKLLTDDAVFSIMVVYTHQLPSVGRIHSLICPVWGHISDPITG